MRQYSTALRFPITSVCTAALVGFMLLNSSIAPAAIANFAVNEATVSNVEGARATVGTGTGTPTAAPVVIYGGTAGSTGTNCGSTTTTCNTCVLGTLDACNERRINPNLIVQISFTSGIAGYPLIIFQGATQVAVPQVGTPPLVGIGGVATINVRWGDLCTNLSVGSSAGAAPGCVLATDVFASGKFFVGVTAVQGATAFATTDESREVQVVLKKGDILSPSASTSGTITQFKMVSGDNKGSITALQTGAGSAFPNAASSPFRWVRLLFAKRSAPNTPVWATLNMASPHVDLDIVIQGNVFNVSPARIEGGIGYDTAAPYNPYSLAINNDQVYDFRVAVVDKARNAGFYTTNDTVCTSPTTSIGGSGPECHTIRPSEVAGILAENVNCFVATAAYGSPMAYEVSAFRAFRDRFLVPTKLGKAFVRFYYKKGPIAAHFIAKNDTLRAISRGLLWGPLQFAKFANVEGLAAALLLLTLLTLSPFAAWYLIRRRKDRRSDLHA